MSRYDPVTNTLADIETGTIIVQFQDEDELPPQYWQSRKDYLYALHLQAAERAQIPSSTTVVNSGPFYGQELDEQIHPSQAIQKNQSSLDRAYASIDNRLSGVLPTALFPNKGTRSNDYALEAEYERQFEKERIRAEQSSDTSTTNMNSSAVVGSGQQNPDDSYRLAYALQMLEFGIVDEELERRERRLRRIQNGEDPDFENEESRNWRCYRQILTISTAIGIAQILIFIIMVERGGGIVSRSQNSMIGPSAATLVDYGAKDAYLITEKGEWWRLVTPIFLHAGVIHIIFNILLQFNIGGYLNLVFGSVYWFLIYFLAGIYGNMFSCIFLPNTVGVGSSGALIGMIGAWIVWMIFRWRKIPQEYHAKRNCQLVWVVISIALTLGFSFAPLIDWAAHFGGFIMGVLTGCFFLAGALENRGTIIAVRILSLSCTVAAYAWAINYMLVKLDPEDPFKAK